MSDFIRAKMTNKTQLYQALRKSVPMLDQELREALEDLAVNFIAAAAAAAPKDKGDLVESLRWQWSRNTQNDPNRSPVIVMMAGADELDKDGFHASFIEHGTTKMARQPFFFPTWRIHRRKLRGRVTRAMSRALKLTGLQSKAAGSSAGFM